MAPDLEFRHSGRVDADTAIVDILAARPFSDRGRTAVITDDRALTERARRVGGLTRRLDWLKGRLEAADRSPVRGSAPIGAGRKPKGTPTPAAGADDDAEREPWKPGRGATRKKGNPRRGRPQCGEPRGKPKA